MDFIDRERETKRLKKALHSDRSELIVIYGRRRMGKSELIKRVIGQQDIYYEADTNEPQIQIDLLTRDISRIYPELDGASFNSWDSIFISFNRLCVKNTTLVLDEFPYLVKRTPALPSIIQRLVDSGTLRFNLILCGSSQRMIQNMILNSSEPLYGRATEKINLGPVGVRHWRDYFNLPSVEAIREFSVWGGVPRYWVLRERYDSLSEAMDELALDSDGLLFNEPATLFMDEFSDIAPYASIMTALGNGINRFSKIADAVGRKTSDLTQPLQNLQSMHYLCREVPYGDDDNKSKRSLYHLCDPFISFYYRFIAPNKSLLSLGRTGIVKGDIDRHLPELTSFTWERMCREAVAGNSLCGHEWGMARRWWGNVPVFEEGKKTACGYDEIELDVVAGSRDGKYILIGECKWAHEDFADRLFRVLETKVRKMQRAGIAFLKDKQPVFILFLMNRPINSFEESETHHILYPDDIIDNL